MGKDLWDFDEKPKKRHKKKKKYKKLKKEKYKTRAEFLLSTFDPDVLDLWFGDDKEQREHFGQWLIHQEDLDTGSMLDDLHDENEALYEKKIKKERYREHDSINDIIIGFRKIEDLRKKEKKGKKLKKKLRNKDLGLATYMDSSRYRKSYLNNDEYRKCLKKIAKQERSEEKEMRKLGYIRSKDPDDELKKLQKMNSYMGDALTDAYVQKHFLN